MKADWFLNYHQIQTTKMYAFKITIKNNRFKEKHDQQYEDWVQLTYNYIYFLERTGQIIKTKHHHVVVDKNVIQVNVLCPGMDSLSLKFASKYNLKTIKQIEKNSGSKITSTFIGRDADNPSYKIPKQSSFYILKNGLESPLLCGDTHRPIPLYTIPCTDHKGIDYDNIYFWDQDFERLNGLWLSSGSYESFAEEQMQDVYSAINKQGRELCTKIEKLTGVPTYYFLHNYRACSKEKDKQRKCPITGNDWYIKGKTETDFIAFKCDESRLVSELSANSSESEEPLQRSHFELHGKMLDFTIEAVDFRIKTNQALMADKNISENDYSDLANDTELLKIIHSYLQGQ